MALSRLKYETDNGVVVQIRLSDTKAALAGAPPAGAIDQPGWLISVNASRRSQNKRKARAWVYSRFETTTGGLKAVETIRLPKLTPAAFNAAAPETQEYEGNTYTFVNKDAEG